MQITRCFLVWVYAVATLLGLGFVGSRQEGTRLSLAEIETAVEQADTAAITRELDALRTEQAPTVQRYGKMALIAVKVALFERIHSPAARQASAYAYLCQRRALELDSAALWAYYRELDPKLETLMRLMTPKEYQNLLETMRTEEDPMVRMEARYRPTHGWFESSLPGQDSIWGDFAKDLEELKAQVAAPAPVRE